MTHEEAAPLPLPGGGGPDTDYSDTPQVTRAPSRPVIAANNRQLREITFSAFFVLRNTNRDASILAHGSHPARVRTDGDRPVLERLTVDSLRQVMADRADWFRIRKTRDGDEEWVPTFPPHPVMATMLATPDWPVPPVERIVEVPVFAPDGTVQTTVGYQAASRTVYCPPSGFVLPPVSDSPSGPEIDAARRFIVEELLGDFPFVSAADRAHAVAALLLPFVRAMIDGPTPMILVSAPTRGTGKTLLARAVAYPTVGNTLAVQTEAKSEDEWRKKVGAALSSGPAVVFIDNVIGWLGSGALAAALTFTVYEDRRLGKNDEMIRYPNRALWIVTANNLNLSEDIVRRTVPILLDAGMEKPYDREQDRFRHPDLERWMRTNRANLVWAALTLGRAWVAAGRPAGQRTIGSYEDWSRVLGGILDVAGIGGFLDNIDEFRSDFDPEMDGWRDLIAAWMDAYGAESVGAVELLTLYRQGEDFLNIGNRLDWNSDRSAETTLGKRLVKNRNRVFGGFRIEHAGKLHGGNRWRLTEVRGQG